MEPSQCRCKHSNSWDSGNNESRTVIQGPDQFKRYPVQPSLPYSSQQNFAGGLTCQPGSQKASTQYPKTSFHDAVNGLKLEAVEEILRGNPSLVHEKGFNGQFPLHRACLRGDPEIVSLLLRYKADPNATDDFDETPLHFACKRANLGVIHNLLMAGARLDAEDRAGKGVLHHAAHGGSILMTHYLLEICSLSPFVCDRNISTPMHIICSHGHVELFEYFLKKERCDPFSKDAQGNTLLHISASNGNGLMCSRLLQHSGYSLLRERNAEGCTALDLAKRGSQPKYKELVTMLSYYDRKPHQNGLIEGPVLAWYGLLLLPVLMLPLTLLIAYCFANPGPVTLLGVLLFLAFRFFHSHRMNHTLRWPSPAHAGMFFTGMFFTSCCFYFELMPNLYRSHPVLVVLSFILTMSMFYMYAVLLKKDPGVVRTAMEKPGCGGAFYSTEDIATGVLKPDRFCAICELIPPIMASHCRLCNRCYSRIDHHCLYLYRCVAEKNHRLFMLFTTVVLTSMIVFEYACVRYFQILYPESHFGWPLVSSVFSECPFVWSLLVLNGISIVWCIWLMRIQLLTIAKGNISTYQPYYAKSRLSVKQRVRNIIRFILDKELHVYSANEVCNA